MDLGLHHGHTWIGQDAPAPTLASDARFDMPALDYVRFAAASAVMLYHFGTYFPYDCQCVAARMPSLAAASWWGWVGVQIFFVISGFVIALSAERRSAVAFVRSRVLRLAPALWFFAILAFGVLLLRRDSAPVEAVLLLAKSIVLFPIGPWVDGVYWSLTVEIAFYALVFGLISFGRLPSLLTIAKVWSLVSAILAVMLIADVAGGVPKALVPVLHSVRDGYWSRYLLITTGSYFALGVALYAIRREGLTRAWMQVAAMAFASSAVFIGFWAVREEPQAASGVFVLLPVLAFALAVGIVAASALGAFGKLDAMRARSFGLASYSLYLVHFVIGKGFYDVLLAAAVTPFAALALTFAACIVFSFIFAIRIEPLLRSKLAIAYDAVLGRHMPAAMQLSRRG